MSLSAFDRWKIEGLDGDSHRRPKERALAIGSTATVYNGPTPVLLRHLAGDAGGVTVDDYDIELGPYERYTWTVTAESVYVALTPAPAGPRGADYGLRATLTEVPEA